MCKQHFTKVRITEMLFAKAIEAEKDVTSWFILYLKTSYWFLVMEVILPWQMVRWLLIATKL